MKKKLKFLRIILTIVLAVAVFLFILRFEKDQKLEEGQEIEVNLLDSIKPIPKQDSIFGFPKNDYQITESSIKRNEFLANILMEYNVDFQIIDKLAKKSKDIFDVRSIRAGKPYTILSTKDSTKKALYFIYQPNPVEYVVYGLTDSLDIYKTEKQIITKIETAEGTIQSSLYQTLQEKNNSPALAISMADIYAWSIDFYRIQKGDWFKIIYEKQYVDDQPIGIGKILAAEFMHSDQKFLAFYFEQEGKVDYFDEEANSLRKAFLKSPLKYSRLSSHYSKRRFHPVQKRWKAHLGTDYAAPTGTPIMSTGDGTVIKSSYTGGNGNYVKIKHNSVYTTQYLHMSKRKAKVGDYVKQGDIIGFVGSTGLATGPHVCYRFWKNGSQVNHLNEDFPSAEPINAESKATFLKQMENMKQRLNQIELSGEDDHLMSETYILSNKIIVATI